MNFIADQQTLSDLNVLGKYKPDSIFNLFNRCRSRGGEKLLEDMFRQPLTSAEQISGRTAILRYFQQEQLVLPFTGDQLQEVNEYLYSYGKSSRLAVMTLLARKKLLQALVRDDAYTKIREAVANTVTLLQQLRQLTGRLGVDSPFGAQVKQLQRLFEQLSSILAKETTAQGLSMGDVIYCHRMLTSVYRDEVLQAMDIISHMDVYIAVSDVAREKGFALATVLRGDAARIRITGLYHPQLPRAKAVANDLAFDSNSNMLFLTGANMAGKSTLMKAYGIAVYLAHIGMPVAAESMELPVMDGLYSSINVPDSLAQGYSHFYAEVLRVKKVAEDVSSGKKMVVIFDELFKGTNVRDAYEATLAVTKAFAAWRPCFFIISTHIIEAGSVLQSVHNNLQFMYLPTIMEGNTPRYTFQLAEGITRDRQGMLIIENEKILELLET